MLKNPDRFTSEQRRRAALMGAGVIVSVAAALTLTVFAVCSLISGGTEPQSEEITSSQQQEEIDEKLSPAVLPETEDAGEEYLEQTLFIGDSNTVRLEGFGEIEMNNMAAVVGMGVQSVPDSDCIWFAEYSQPVTIPRAARLLQPQRMIVMYGTNNTDMSVEEFIEAYEDALDALEESWPYADLIIASVPPVGKNKPDAKKVQKTIDDFNEVLIELAEQRELPFLNSAQALKGADGYLKSEYAEADGMHFTAQGAKAFVEYVRTHSYITEDRRPALQSQPTRIDPPYQPEESEPEESESQEVAPTPEPTPTPTPTPSTTPTPGPTPSPTPSAPPEPETDPDSSSSSASDIQETGETGNLFEGETA